MATKKDEMPECLKEVPRMKGKLIRENEVNEISTRMKLLSHPTRLQILKLLCEKDLCVCVLSDVIGRRQPNISQHLTKLKDSGIIESYQSGKFVYYRIKDQRLREIIGIICKRWIG